MSAALAAAAAGALFVFWAHPNGDGGKWGGAGASAAEPPRPLWAIAWRSALEAHTDVAPCAFSNGWVVADGAGHVVCVSPYGRVRWRASFSNEVFAGASAVDGRAALASENGRVILLDADTGAALWQRATGGRFVHVPLVGALGPDPVLWLVSQDDGRLFCLRAADGALLWTSEATNRCDGSPTAQAGLVAYGNCDGAIYVFAATTGALCGKVEVGPEDQMAGGALSLPGGRVVAGTRSGNLVVVDLKRRKCEATIKVSESEAFVTPVPCLPSSSFAMAVGEGDVSVWNASTRASPKRASIVALGKAIDSLASCGRYVFALSSGTLAVLDGPRVVSRVQLGDAVGALGVDANGALACVADGALVCVKEGGS